MAVWCLGTERTSGTTCMSQDSNTNLCCHLLVIKTVRLYYLVFFKETVFVDVKGEWDVLDWSVKTLFYQNS